MADATETVTSPDTAISTPETSPTNDATVLGGAQEAASDTPAADPAQTDADASPAPVVPEKYELALEGVTLDPELVTAADPVLRELNLSNEAANKLLPLAQQMMERTQSAIATQLQDAAAVQRKEWLDAYHADPEIGGANREATEKAAARGLDAMGYTKDHPFRTLLNESGLGNHPDMIRFFRRFGELIGEDATFARTNTAPVQRKPAWERLYPDDVK